MQRRLKEYGQALGFSIPKEFQYITVTPFNLKIIIWEYRKRLSNRVSSHCIYKMTSRSIGRCFHWRGGHHSLTGQRKGGQRGGLQLVWVRDHPRKASKSTTDFPSRGWSPTHSWFVRKNGCSKFHIVFDSMGFITTVSSLDINISGTYLKMPYWWMF